MNNKAAVEETAGQTNGALVNVRATKWSGWNHNQVSAHGDKSQKRCWQANILFLGKLASLIQELDEQN